jgi:hypothetical protein
MSPAALLGWWHDTDELNVYRPYLVADGAATWPPGLVAIDSPAPTEGSNVNWLNIFYAVEWAIFAGFAFYMWYRLARMPGRRGRGARGGSGPVPSDHEGRPRRRLDWAPCLSPNSPVSGDPRGAAFLPDRVGDHRRHAPAAVHRDDHQVRPRLRALRRRLGGLLWFAPVVETATGHESTGDGVNLSSAS